MLMKPKSLMMPVEEGRGATLISLVGLSQFHCKVERAPHERSCHRVRLFACDEHLLREVERPTAQEAVDTAHAMLYECWEARNPLEEAGCHK